MARIALFPSPAGLGYPVPPACGGLLRHPLTIAALEDVVLPVVPVVV